MKYDFVRSLARLMPTKLRVLVRSRISLMDYYRRLADQNDPYSGDPPFHICTDSPCTLGIIREFFHYHKHYIAACRELGVSYKLIDISNDGWMRDVEEAGCDAFLVWPTVNATIWKEMFDDRLRILQEQLGRIVYPTFRETWLYENKRRCRDFLAAHRLPQPRTWIFYDHGEAKEFAATAELPIVFKTPLGASASGVRILRKRSDLLRLVDRVFLKGIIPSGQFFPQDRQWGSVYLQEYLPDVEEWRMIRIGDSHFGYRKGRVGDFHSGTCRKEWVNPPRPLLDLLRQVTELGEFTSMNVDLFQTKDGRLLINELHTVFGQSTVEQMRVDGRPGRYVYAAAGDYWRFEEGDYSRNACANARVEHLLAKLLGVPVPALRGKTPCKASPRQEGDS